MPAERTEHIRMPQRDAKGPEPPARNPANRPEVAVVHRAKVALDLRQQLFENDRLVGGIRWEHIAVAYRTHERHHHNHRGERPQPDSLVDSRGDAQIFPLCLGESARTVK